MNILIFGAAGFIGRGLLSKITEYNRLNDYNKIRLFCRSEINIKLANNVEIFVGDFQKKTDIQASLQGMDTVIHLISETNPGNSALDPTLEIYKNLIPTIEMIQLLPKFNVSKLIFASSGGTVYGEWCGEPAKETSQTNPISNYGIAKLTIEKLLLKLQMESSIKVNILRVSNPYGLSQNISKGQGALTTLIISALANRKIEIWGDGSIVRDYIHINDVADAFLKSIHYKGDNSIFNISSGKGYSLNDLINLISDLLKKELNLSFKDNRSFDLKKNILDSSLASKELNWAPQITLSDGIKMISDEIQHSKFYV
jgi:UDP-glucose 4-epimerase